MTSETEVREMMARQAARAQARLIIEISEDLEAVVKREAARLVEEELRKVMANLRVKADD